MVMAENTHRWTSKKQPLGCTGKGVTRMRRQQ
jgi:hypothetical protein